MTLTEWFVTVRLSPVSTRDVRIRARSEYSARWLCRLLHPTADVIASRPVVRCPNHE